MWPPRTCTWAITALILAGPLSVSAGPASRPSLPPGGREIAGSGDDPAATPHRYGAPDFARYEPLAVTGQPFAKALRVTVTRQPDILWGVQVNYDATEPVKRGDVLLAELTVRGEGTMGRQAQIQVLLDKGSPEWDNFATCTFALKPQWETYFLPCVALNDYPAGATRISIRLGFPPQTVEIGPVRMYNYGTRADVRKLPRTRFTYAGREPDAAWRQAAAERIEKIRKAPLRVRVLDAAGRPVPDADVRVEMTQHAFAFASAASATELIRGKGPASDKYRDMVEKLFPSVTVEWEVCWQPWEWDRQLGLDAVDWLCRRGKVIHGCHIIWGGLMWMPKDCAAMKDDPEALRRRIYGHIDDKLSTLRGRVVEWNAVNEPYSEQFVTNVLGRHMLVDIFRRAAAADPRARLGINDFGDVASFDEKHRDHYFDTVKYLVEQGAPVQVIGMQGHFGSNVHGPEKVLECLDRFAVFGLPIHISELDVNTIDDEFQADFLRDVMTVFFSHPAVEKVTLWGFWEGRHWLPNSALWRRDWSIKPSGQAWMDLVYRDWWTRAGLRSDADGRCATRGFLGRYTITATAGARTRRVEATLNRDGTEIDVRLD